MALKNCWTITCAGGRHSAKCYKDGAVAIDFRKCGGIAVDADAKTVKAEAGVLNGTLERACADYGLIVSGAGWVVSTTISSGTFWTF